MKLKIFLYRSAAFLLILLIFLELFGACFFVTSNAASSSYSGVLEDLKKDPKFDASEYPVNNEDYTLEIISIAEGTNGELFIYVYQPCVERELRATYINIALQHPNYLHPAYQLFSLTWLSSDGVFSKYLVNNLEILQQEERYYNITAVYRAFNAEVDEPAAEADDKKEHVAFPVGLHWVAHTYNDVVFYKCGKSRYVDVEILSVGIIEYNEGFSLQPEKCHSHFVAFKVNNFDVKKIYDATITYTRQDFVWTYSSGTEPFEEFTSEPEMKTRDLSDAERGHNNGGFLASKYTWQRIVSIDEFDAQLTEHKIYEQDRINFIKGGLEEAEFVFQFLETDLDITILNSGSFIQKSGTKVTNVGILRLHFMDESENQYNLGAVSDLVSDDGNPDLSAGTGKLVDDIKKIFDGFLPDLFSILGVVLVLLFVIFFFGPILTIIKWLINVLNFLLSLAVWLISLPFKLMSRHKRE